MDSEQPGYTNKSAKTNKTSLIVTIILLIVVAALVVVFLWYTLLPQDDDTPLPSVAPPASNENVGACNGEENTAPDGFTFYENEDLGFTFAYPQEWGDVSIATDPHAGLSGHYLMGNFSENDDVWFGGNATDYVVGGRGGMPTDNPGYLVANNQFYQVEIWKVDDTGGSAPPEDHHELHPITEPSELKEGCNTKALATRDIEAHLLDSDYYDIARFNLQPDNLYYGVNVILRNPDEASRAQLEQLISTFELIP